MATNTKQLPEVLFYMHYAAKGIADEQAGANVDFISKLKPTWFTPKIVVCCRSFYEFPDAADDPNVRGTLEVCRQRGFEVVAGRDVWVRDGKRAQDETEWCRAWNTGEHASVTLDYMASTFDEVRAFSRAIGATETFLDLEPNGTGPYDYLKLELAPNSWRVLLSFVGRYHDVNYARPYGHPALHHAYQLSGRIAESPVHWSSEARFHPWICDKRPGLHTWHPHKSDKAAALRLLERPDCTGLFCYFPSSEWARALEVING